MLVRAPSLIAKLEFEDDQSKREHQREQVSRNYRHILHHDSIHQPKRHAGKKD